MLVDFDEDNRAYDDISTEFPKKKKGLFTSSDHVKDKYFAQYMGMMV